MRGEPSDSENQDMVNEPTVQCAFRLPRSLVDQVDAFAEAMTADQPGMVFTRADAVRMLLSRALGPEKRPRKAKKR